MMKGLLIIFSVLSSIFVLGQNTYRFSQFNFVKSLYNPGALASDAKFTADLIYRNQWAGVNGAPATIGFNSAYEITEDMAVGINFYNDQIGLNQTNSVSAMYAYRLLFDTRKYLSFGLGIGADNVVSNFAGAATTQANDPVFAESYSKFKLNGSFGIYYRSTNFYTGISVPQLFQNAPFGSETGVHPTRWHYMGIIGYYWELSERFILNPNVQLKGTWNAPLQGDILIRGISNSIGFSIGYRSENSLIAGVDFTLLNKIRIGYAFNYDVGSLARTKGMSHEVYLGLGLPYYFNSDTFENRKYVGRKGGSKLEYRRRYHRRNKQH